MSCSTTVLGLPTRPGASARREGRKAVGRSSSATIAGIALAGITLLAGCASHEAEASPSDPPQAPLYTNKHLPEAPTNVYTNKDLKPGPSAGVVVRKPPPIPKNAKTPARQTAPITVVAPPTPIVALTIVEVEKQVADARASVEELERRLLAIHNPFLPRPQLSAAEARAWVGLDNVQRAERVEGQLANARAQLAAAIDRVAVLQTTARR